MVERPDGVYVIGSAAMKIAFAWSSNDKPFRRPMKDGLLSVDEKSAFNVLAVIVKSIVGEVPEDGTVVSFSVPAPPVNSDRDPEYHKRVISQILERADFGGNRVVPIPCGEGRAVVMAELEKTGYTGLGLSFGAGMVNASLCVYGVPVFEFSLVGSGDWIDVEAARSSGEDAVSINRRKTRVDVRTSDHQDHVDRAIAIHYVMLIDKIARGICESVKRVGVRGEDPFPVVVAGGTASPEGFVGLFESRMRALDWGKDFSLGEFWLAKDHAHAIARGLLVHAEIAEL